MTFLSDCYWGGGELGYLYPVGCQTRKIYPYRTFDALMVKNSSRINTSHHLLYNPIKKPSTGIISTINNQQKQNHIHGRNYSKYESHHTTTTDCCKYGINTPHSSASDPGPMYPMWVCSNSLQGPMFSLQFIWSNNHSTTSTPKTSGLYGSPAFVWQLYSVI